MSGGSIDHYFPFSGRGGQCMKCGMTRSVWETEGRSCWIQQMHNARFQPGTGGTFQLSPVGSGGAASSDSTNPKDLVGEKKPPLWLVPSALTIVVSKVMQLGAKKYGPYNWRTKKVKLTVYLTAAMRHLLSTLDGEDIDPESGQPHIAHAAACMAILLDAKATGNLIDDRPTPGAAGRLIEELTEKVVDVLKERQ